MVHENGGVSKSLLSMGSSREVVPPLRRIDGSWAKSALEKANLLAQTFANKSHLDPAVVNENTPVPDHDSTTQADPPRIRGRHVRRSLAEFDEISCTRPSGISARV